MNCKNEYFKIHSGESIPLIGFGTYQIQGRALIHEVIDYALGAGYRLIDTAAAYGNEQDIGVALKKLLPKYNLTRSDIFITSKLPPSEHGPKAKNAVAKSLSNLQCGYIDLYLIHWPGVQGVLSASGDNAKLRAASWDYLVEAKRKGLVRSIGVSNYTVRHLTELLAICKGVKPAVNQVEWHPRCHQKDLKDLCKREGIVLQAYSSLGGTDNPGLIQDPLVVSIASKLGKSPAQILLRWATQQNIAVIPKAQSKARIEENIELNFVIPDEDMNALSSQESRRYAWDPTRVQ